MAFALTSDNLRALDDMETEDPEEHLAYYAKLRNTRVNSGGQLNDVGDGECSSSTAFDSDEERLDRLMTPREELEEDPEYIVATSKKFEALLAPAGQKHHHAQQASHGNRATVEDDAEASAESGPLMWYFAYGSNMNVAQLLTRIGAFETKQLMYLPDYTLTFNKKVSLKASAGRLNGNASKCGFANIIPKDGDRVYGIAYLVHESQIKKMDVFEGVGSGHYYRETMRCYDESDRYTNCEVYIACPEACGDGLLPTDGYLSHLLGGRGLLPSYYVEQLQKQKTTKR